MSVPFTREGFHSEVVRKKVSSLNTYKAVKRIGAGIGGFPISRVTDLVEEIREYQRLLEVIGVPVPPIEEIHLEYPNKENAVIVVCSPWGGDDVGVILSSLCARCDKEKIEWLVKEMCRILLLVCTHQRDDGKLSVGIDAKAANFTVTAGTTCRWTMSYVDQFPPRYWKNGSPLIDWVPLKTKLANDLGQFMYFDWRGVLLTFISQFSRIKPLLKESAEAIAFREFAKHIKECVFKEFCDQFLRLPWMVLRSFLREKDVKRAEQIVKECIWQKVYGICYSPYTLREVALEFALYSIISHDELEKIYHDCHMEDEEFSCDRLSRIQDDLCRFLRRSRLAKIEDCR